MGSNLGSTSCLAIGVPFDNEHTVHRFLRMLLQYNTSPAQVVNRKVRLVIRMLPQLAHGFRSVVLAAFVLRSAVALGDVVVLSHGVPFAVHPVDESSRRRVPQAVS